MAGELPLRWSRLPEAHLRSDVTRFESEPGEGGLATRARIPATGLLTNVRQSRPPTWPDEEGYRVAGPVTVVSWDHPGSSVLPRATEVCVIDERRGDPLLAHRHPPRRRCRETTPVCSPPGLPAGCADSCRRPDKDTTAVLRCGSYGSESLTEAPRRQTVAGRCRSTTISGRRRGRRSAGPMEVIRAVGHGTRSPLTDALAPHVTGWSACRAPLFRDGVVSGAVPSRPGRSAAPPWLRAALEHRRTVRTFHILWILSDAVRSTHQPTRIASTVWPGLTALTLISSPAVEARYEQRRLP